MHKGNSVPKVKPDTILDNALIEITKKSRHYSCYKQNKNS